MPPPLGYELASLNLRNPLGDPQVLPPLEFPKVDRSKKGDALVSRPREPLPKLQPQHPSKPPSADAASSEDKDARFDSFPQYDTSQPYEPPAAGVDSVDLPYTDFPPTDLAAAARAGDDGAGSGAAQLYFGIDPMSSLQSIVPWEPGEAPVVMLPHAGDLDIKLSALTPAPDAGEADRGFECGRIFLRNT